MPAPASEAGRVPPSWSISYCHVDARRKQTKPEIGRLATGARADGKGDDVPGLDRDEIIADLRVAAGLDLQPAVFVVAAAVVVVRLPVPKLLDRTDLLERE